MVGVSASERFLVRREVYVQQHIEARENPPSLWLDGIKFII